MRKTVSVLLFISIAIFSFTNCSSDKLTKTKVNEIIEDCERDSYNLPVRINVGDFSVGNLATADLDKYQDMHQKGLIQLDTLKPGEMGYRTLYRFNVKILDKARKYHISTDTIKYRKKATFTAKTYVLEDIQEIHEVPSKNTANIKLVYKTAEKTPFNDYLNQGKNSELKELKVEFRKTDEGWKFCD